MVDFEGYRRRSRRKEVQPRWNSLEWEEDLWDVKPRGNQSFFFGGYAEESLSNDARRRLHTKHTNSQMATSSSRVKTQSYQYPPHYDILRVSSKKSSSPASTRRSGSEEQSKRRSPGVIAKLMGLDVLPFHKSTVIEDSRPAHFKDRASEVFKDVYEVSDTRRSPIRNKSPSRSRRLSENSRDFESLEDPFFRLLHEPSSLFIKHLEECRHSSSTSSDAGPIVILKSSDAEPSDSPNWRRTDQRSWYNTEEERSLSLSRRDRNPRPRKMEEMTHDHIVVLEPGLGGFPEARFKDSRERKKISLARSSRGIAREITEQMVRNDGEEARKQLLERWKTLQKSAEGRARRRRSRTTLAQMLALAKRDISGSSGIERERRRSSSYEHPCLGTMKNMEESFLRREEKKKKLPRVEEKPMIEEFTSLAGRKKMGKDAVCSVEINEHPSPVSVLEPPDESVSSLDHFDRVKVDRETKPAHQQHLTSTSENAEAEEIRLTFEDEDNLEFCYMLDILIDSGLYKVDRDMLLRAAFSPESPVDPQVFENLETIYSHLPWPGMNRKLMFDLVNCILARISESLARVRPGKVNKLLVQEVWESLIGKSTAYDAAKLTFGEIDDMTWGGWMVDFDGLGVEVESMLNDELLEELVTEVCVI
ncbi:uncharacterized protein LOC144706474 [Wolffia australiana]